jgi:hypothetical protein
MKQQLQADRHRFSGLAPVRVDAFDGFVSFHQRLPRPCGTGDETTRDSAVNSSDAKELMQ